MTLQRRVTNLSRPKRASLRVRGAGALDELQAMETLVREQNACALPGCTVKYNSFMSCLRRAVSRGFVKDVHAEFVEDGLRNGFSIGIVPGSLKGRRVFNNYPSAHTAPESVSAAVFARVKASKTLCLGLWSDLKSVLSDATSVRRLCVAPSGSLWLPGGGALWTGGKGGAPVRRTLSKRTFERALLCFVSEFCPVFSVVPARPTACSLFESCSSAMGCYRSRCLLV